MIGRLTRLLVLAMLAPALCAFTLEAGVSLASNASLFLLNGSTYGFLCYVLLSTLFLSRKPGFWGTLEHEFEHAVAGRLLGHRPQKLIVDAQGDSATSFTRNPNALILLAPYYLPLLTILLLIAKLVAGLLCPSVRDALDFVIGFTLAAHYGSAVRQFSRRQTDITKTGLLFSCIVTLTMNVILLVIIAGMVVNNYLAIRDYFARSLVRSLESYDFLLQVWRGPK